MGDRHGGCFARRGRALNPPRPQVDAHREVGLRWRARAKRFVPRRNAPHGEGLPTRRTSERICPAQERSPRRRPPDTAHGRKDLPPRGTRPRGEGLPTRRTGERICPRRNTPLGEGLPTRRTSERICPARERSPRRRPPDTAHERKDLPRARRLPSAKASRHGARAKEFAHARRLSSEKASRHGARAKGFAPRRNAPRGEGIPTRRTSEGICPAREGSPRRKPPDTAHGRKDLPRGVRPRPTCRRTAGRPRPTDSRKTPLRRGRTHSACGHCRVHSPKKNKTTP